jgi:ubiquinone/menaquinone biosynthesis C-methylase UbiE
MENNDEVYQYYENYNENERIERHPIEFIRSKEIISRYLPSMPIKIADLCGASGHYAYWLAEKGHEVHLMDLSEKHIKETIANKEKYNVELSSIKQGDARSTDFKNETFDMVLLMGALYHLQEKDDRIKCIKETYRILKQGGIVVFSYISRYGSILDGFTKGLINDPLYLEIMEKGYYTGIHKNIKNKTKYFTNAYFHSMKEIYDELLFSNYNNIIVYGVEGFSTLLNEKEYMSDERKLKMLLKYLKLFEQDIEMMGVSHHRLAICKK